MAIKVDFHNYDEITGLYSEASKDAQGLWIGGRWHLDYWGKEAREELMLRHKLSLKGFEFCHYRAMENSYADRVVARNGEME